MSNIDIPNVVPSVFMIEDPTTTSKSILRKQELEFLPHQLGKFNYDTDRLMRFTLSSNTDVLIGPESFFRFKLNLINVDQDYAGISLEDGGVHNLFRSVEIRALSSGMLIQRYDHYNKYAALYTNLNDSKDYVRNLGAMYLDELNCDKTNNDYSWRPLRGGLIQSSAADGTSETMTVQAFAVGTFAPVTGMGGNYGMVFAKAAGFIKANNVRVGDVLFNPTANPIVLALGISIAANGSLVVHNVMVDKGIVVLSGGTNGAVAAADAIVDGTLAPLIFLNEQQCLDQGTMTASQVQGYQSVSPQDMWNYDGTSEIHFKPFCSIFQHNLPLFLFRGGIEIIFELEDPKIALYSRSRLASFKDTARVPAVAYTASPNYEIESARFMGSMVTPHPDIVTEYVNQWKTNRGLIYRIPSFEVRRVSRVKSAEENLNMHFGVRSALRGFLLQLDASDDTANYARRSNTSWLKMELKNYQFKVGSHEFPHRDIDVSTDTFSVYKHLALANHANSAMQRLDYAAFGGHGFSQSNGQNLSGGLWEANKFILPVDFTRMQGYAENGLTGIDLSIVPLETKLTRTQVPVGSNNDPATFINYYMIIEYDAYLKVSSSQMNVLS